MVEIIDNWELRNRMRSRYEEEAYTGYLGKPDFRNQSVISSRPVTVVSSTIHTFHHNSLHTTTTSRVVSTSSSSTSTGSTDDYPELLEPPSPTSSVASSRYDSLCLEDLDIIKTIGTGTFGKVVLAQDTETGEYSALKILSLYDLIRMKQVDHVKNEKNILKAIKHPFIVSLKWYCKDEYNIYFLMDFACGGELFSYLRKAGKFTISTSSFYSAELISAIEYLHCKNIAHRDLKPENLLLDKEGHLKITDFGFSKRLREKTWTLCGTPEYLAPEIIQSKGYTKAVDWWAFGVLVYEMLTGSSPFYGDSKISTYERILSGKIEWPKHMESVAKDLIKKMLAQDRSKRLGCGKNGADEIKRHKFFREYDWSEVNQRKLTPPIIPKIYYEGDTGNFDNYPDTWRIRSVTEEELELFDDF